MTNKTIALHLHKLHNYINYLMKYYQISKNENALFKKENIFSDYPFMYIYIIINKKIVFRINKPRFRDFR